MPDFSKGYKLAPAKVHGTRYIVIDEYDHYLKGVLSIYCPDCKLYEVESDVHAWIVTPLILSSILNIPISHITDNVDVLEKIVKKK